MVLSRYGVHPETKMGVARDRGRSDMLVQLEIYGKKIALVVKSV